MTEENKIIPVTDHVMFKALFVKNPDLLKSFLISALNLLQKSQSEIRSCPLYVMKKNQLIWILFWRLTKLLRKPSILIYSSSIRKHPEIVYYFTGQPHTITK